jgi:hypothetical protein
MTIPLGKTLIIAMLSPGGAISDVACGGQHEAILKS